MFIVSDQCLKERFLCERDFILTKFVDAYHAAESTRSDLQVMSESESVVVNTV